MIPKNKRHLIVNKEYSRLPYWTDEGYDDVQRSTSQKFVQDNYGKFDESENQQSYKNDNDEDYQALEYNYSLPEFDSNFDDLDIDPASVTKKDIKCDEYWNQLFPGHPTGSGPFIPDSGDLSVLNIYAKKCPVEYKDHMCCGRGLRVQGPVNGELESEQNYKFGVGNKPRECDYNFWAKIGTMWNDGRYTAPYTETEITDTMGVTARGGWSLNKDCLTWKVKIKPKTDDCDGKIGYTTLQMSTGATQELTVTGSTGGTYNWSTTSGSLSAPSGDSVIFTAPATNANCTSNPTISLTCGGAVVDTLQIAVRSTTFDFNKAAYYLTVVGGPGTVIGPITLRDCEYKVMLMPIRCDGSSPPTWDFPICGSDYANPYTGTCPHCAVLKQAPPGCWGSWAFDRVTDLSHAMSDCASHASVNTSSPYYRGIPCGCANGTVYDVRTAQQKADGCCPAGLL